MPLPFRKKLHETDSLDGCCEKHEVFQLPLRFHWRALSDVLDLHIHGPSP